AVGDSDEKGKFSTQVSNSLIEEALKSVKRRTGEPPVGSGDKPLENGAGAEVPIAVEGEAPAAAAADPREKELADLKVQLEFSMAKGRELMEKLKEGHEKMLR